MAISMARSHRDWCKKVRGRGCCLVSALADVERQNLEAWEEAKAEIAKIPEHPNRAPETEGTANGTAVHGRRDSMATINGK